MSAIISECGTYRYQLTRWTKTLFNSRDTPMGGGTLTVLMLNPSTADARKNDPTIRRCIDLAERQGADELVVVSLFAYRATKPKALREALTDDEDIIGPDNDMHIRDAVAQADKVVCAWGRNGIHHTQRVARVLHMFDDDVELWCLGETQDGHPRHPLMVPNETPLQRYWTGDEDE